MTVLKMNEITSQNEWQQAKINLETAKVPWTQLQRFFAAGQVFDVHASLDLTEVALKMSQDNTEFVQSLMAKKHIQPVRDQQASAWLNADALVWCVVVKPFVLVQAVAI